MLVVYICSGIAGECRTPPEYPAIKDTYYECVQDGLGDAYEILFGSDSIFTPDPIVYLPHFVLVLSDANGISLLVKP